MRHGDKDTYFDDSVDSFELQNIPNFDSDGENSDFGEINLDDISYAGLDNVGTGEHGYDSYAPAVSLGKDEIRRLRAEDTRYERGRSVKIAVAATCAVVIAGAGMAFAVTHNQQTSTSVNSSTPVVVEDSEPETVQATLKANYAKESVVLQRGALLTNVSEASELTGVFAGKYYKGTIDGKTVYVAKSDVRLSTEKTPDEWTGYALVDATVYKNSNLTGDDFVALNLNDELTVLDSFDNLCYVRTSDGYEGFVAADKLSKEQSIENAYEATVTSEGDALASDATTDTTTSDGSTYSSAYNNSYYSGTTYSGGTTYTTPSTTGSSDTATGGTSSDTPTDTSGSGEVVSPGDTSDTGDTGGTGDTSGDTSGNGSWFGIPYAYGDEVSSELSATVLKSDVKTYECLLSADQSFEVESEGLRRATSCSVAFDGGTVALAKNILTFEDDASYDEWTGYAMAGAVLYNDCQLIIPVRTLVVNEPLSVVNETDFSLVVKLDNNLYCVAKDSVSKEEISQPVEGEPEGASASIS